MNATVEERPQWMRILSYLYKQLGEDDVCSALRRRFAVCLDTKVGSGDRILWAVFGGASVLRLRGGMDIPWLNGVAEGLRYIAVI